MPSPVVIWPNAFVESLVCNEEAAFVDHRLLNVKLTIKFCLSCYSRFLLSVFYIARTTVIVSVILFFFDFCLFGCFN